MWPMEKPVDHPQLEPGRGRVGSLEEQRARCEEEVVAEVCTAMLEIQEQLAEQMTTAFAHLEAGLYGYCVNCHRPIAATRLEASPLSVRCESCETERPEHTVKRQMRLAVA
jgi:RNA polymerase-binding transcription factor DksA